MRKHIVPMLVVSALSTFTLVPTRSGSQLARADLPGTEELDVKFPEEAIAGEWWTEQKDGRVKFVKHEDGTYKGILTWGKDARKDQFNKDPKLRERPVIGIVLMWHLRYDDGEYVDGHVYNPEDGGVYKMKAWMAGRDQLKIRGFLGISLFGQTQTWTRVQ